MPIVPTQGGREAALNLRVPPLQGGDQQVQVPRGQDAPQRLLRLDALLQGAAPQGAQQARHVVLRCLREGPDRRAEQGEEEQARPTQHGGRV